MRGPAERYAQLEAVAARIRVCHRCLGMNIAGITEAAPGYGDPHSPVFLIGQSLCGPCMATQIPFTGGSGHLLDLALSSAGVTKAQVFSSNVVHCHPPNNRPSLLHEIQNCSEYLHEELSIVRPILIIGLGKDAHVAVQSWLGSSSFMWSATVQHVTAERPAMLLVPHPAYILRQPSIVRSAYVRQLAGSLRWAFDYGPR